MLKLGFADREAYFGDPEFVDVPLDDLLSDAFAAERVRAIDRDRASPDLPQAGETRLGRPDMPWVREASGCIQANGMHRDTTYLCVVDAAGNGFSATPSDGYCTAGIIPGLGFAVSTRGDQNWIDGRHPSVIEPWKRPRLTPNPALAKKDGRLAFVFGTPGGDMQVQAMLQVFLNHAVRGMDPQAAIEAPRVRQRELPEFVLAPHPQAGRPEAGARLHAARRGPGGQRTQGRALAGTGLARRRRVRHRDRPGKPATVSPAPIPGASAWPSPGDRDCPENAGRCGPSRDRRSGRNGA